MKFSSVVLLFAALLPARAFAEEDACLKMQNAWNAVKTYRCTYRAVTMREGKVSETIMKYSFEKPGKIRMDIIKPRKGAVLIYNPESSDKVQVRPFPGLPGFVLNYELTNKRVTSDSGATLDHSDLGHRTETVCREIEEAYEYKLENPSEITLSLKENNRSVKRKFILGETGLLKKIETRDDKGSLLESFEWLDMSVNPELDENLFLKFQ